MHSYFLFHLFYVRQHSSFFLENGLSDASNEKQNDKFMKLIFNASLIAALTIGFQSFRADIANPVDSFRSIN
jgi:hypothetical protein